MSKIASIYCISIGIISIVIVMAWITSINNPVPMGEIYAALFFAIEGISDIIIGFYSYMEDGK